MHKDLRIISLVPSLSHMICDFGLKAQLVGVTNFCVLPPGLHRSTVLVGGTKDPNLELIKSLNPTHIIVNEEENRAEDIQSCHAIADTFVSFPKSPDDVPSLISNSAQWLGVNERGATLVQELSEALSRLRIAREHAPALAKRRYLYFIWREPFMVASHDTYISSLLSLLGLENAAPINNQRYPTLEISDIQAMDLELIFLSSEPYPFRTRDLTSMLKIWPKMPPCLKADGRLCSWYGSMTAVAIQAGSDWLERRSNDLFQEFKV